MAVVSHQDLLIGVTCRDGPRKFQQPVAKRALAMVYVCDDAEVPVPFDRYG